MILPLASLQDKAQAFLETNPHYSKIWISNDGNIFVDHKLALTHASQPVHDAGLVYKCDGQNFYLVFDRKKDSLKVPGSAFFIQKFHMPS